MNNHLSKNQIRLLEHTLGGEVSSKWYRNNFVAYDGHTDMADLIELEKKGFMKRIGQSSTSYGTAHHLFAVTEDGKKFLIEMASITSKK